MGKEREPMAKAVRRISGVISVAILILQGIPARAQNSDDTGAAVDGETKPEEENLRIEPTAVVHLIYAWTPSADGSEHEMDLARARIGLSVRYKKWVKGEVELDGADPDILFSAWVRIRFAAALQLKGGLFKRPFFRLRLRSAAGLEVIDRGVLDRVLDNGMNYTAHKTGAQLEGTLVKKLKLKYRVGFFSDFAQMHGLVSSNDLAALLSIRPFRELELGAAGEMKFLSSELAFDKRAAAGDVFTGLHIGKFDALLEGVVGQDPRYESVPFFFGFVGLAAYTIDVCGVKPLTALRPVVMGEIVEPDTEIKDDLAWRAAAGLDFLFVYDFRLGVNFERIWYDRNNRDAAAEGNRILALMGWSL
jgi:hypothetical protein